MLYRRASWLGKGRGRGEVSERFELVLFLSCEKPTHFCVAPGTSRGTGEEKSKGVSEEYVSPRRRDWRIEGLTIDEGEEEEHETVGPGEHQLSERDSEEELESDVPPEEALVGYSGDLDGELSEGGGRWRGGSKVVLL